MNRDFYVHAWNGIHMNNAVSGDLYDDDGTQTAMIILIFRAMTVCIYVVIHDHIIEIHHKCRHPDLRRFFRAAVLRSLSSAVFPAR